MIKYNEIAKEISLRTGMSKQNVEMILQEYESILIDNIKRGAKTQLFNLGYFSRTFVKSKMGYNPSTKKKMMYDPYYRIKFSKSSKLTRVLKEPTLQKIEILEDVDLYGEKLKKGDIVSKFAGNLKSIEGKYKVIG